MIQSVIQSNSPVKGRGHAMNLSSIKNLSDNIKSNIRKVIVGNENVIDLLLVALICSGHVLLEDVPGMGKTLLAKTLAKSIDCEFKRIQFTPDLLPSDLTGINYYNQKLGEFQFRPGPVFTNILLADEINRATPRTQSSLLECMEERQVTVDCETHILDKPFMVVATQNPIEIQGTFPLPEAQLDRFLMRIRFGYPSESEGIDILKRFKSDQPLHDVTPVVKAQDIVGAQNAYSSVFVSDAVYKYIIDAVARTRKDADIVLGISPRGSQALLKASQVLAIIRGRDYVLPDDVKTLAKYVLCHRLLLSATARMKDRYAETVMERLLSQVTVPTEEFSFKELGA
jgi:MoxR-like ATPase